MLKTANLKSFLSSSYVPEFGFGISTGVKKMQNPGTTLGGGRVWGGEGVKLIKY